MVLTSGKAYIFDPDSDEYTEFPGLTDINIVCEDDDDPEVIPVRNSLGSLEASFKVVGMRASDLLFAFLGIKDIVIETCPNKRVVHLALRGRKRRTRKKNFKRAIRILEGLND